MKNAMQLKAIIKNLAKEKHISAQLVMQNFMLERLLERISISKYQQNFILKGGFLIAAMVGLDTRATMDMDATIKGLPVNEQTVREMFEEICKIELEDDVTFSFRSIGEIREDGKPSIAEYYEMTEEMATARKENGDLKYGFGVILNYLFSEKKLEQIADARMPIHVVEKKIPYMDVDGTFVKPEQPNGYKFETLVLDMVHMMDDCIPYEVVREREFAPIKNLHGVDSLDSARELMKGCGIEL